MSWLNSYYATLQTKIFQENSTKLKLQPEFPRYLIQKFYINYGFKPFSLCLLTTLTCSSCRPSMT